VGSAAVTAAAAASTPSLQAQGYAFGALGVLIFALTMPMTRLAVGDASAPQLPPAFVTAGRAAVAGVVGAAWLLLARAAWPARRDWPLLALSALGTVLLFPLGLAMALRDVPSMHASVVTGVMPLATAAIAALALRQRASAGFWACAIAGCALVVAFAVLAGGGHLIAADGWLALAVLGAGIGYVSGAQVSLRMPPAQTICWVLVLSLPLTLPAAWWSRPADASPIGAGAWAGFAYVSIFSMWLGFFAWYRGLALGGVMRVSQVQLLQPFVALLAAVPLVGERLEPLTLAFALAVLGVVLIGRRITAPAAVGVEVGVKR
jgi:drug/metabolite transporter (DMT)-like permease